MVFSASDNLDDMNQQPVYIFSYGSNTLLQRISERVPSVAVVGKHQLRGYRLLFNKLSVDGSTKANLKETGDQSDSVWGVIHQISKADKPILDRYEALGKGYLEIGFKLTIHDESQSVHAYIATESQYLAVGKPYDWYLNFVIEGAIENGFPEDYINQLKAIASKLDPDLTRQHANEEVLVRSRG